MAWPGIADKNKKVRNILADVKPLMLNTTKKGASGYVRVEGYKGGAGGSVHKACTSQQKVTGVHEYLRRDGPKPGVTTASGKSYRQGCKP